MKLDWRLVLVLVLSLGLMVGCTNDDEEEETATAFETLTEYMIAQDLDSPTVISSWIIGAGDVSGNEDMYFIMDIRSAEKYAEGHIPGAVNCGYADVVTTAEAQNTDDKPILVACYSGQSAAHAVVALRLAGYSSAKSVMWGMSGWAMQFDSWTGACANIAVDNASWTDDAPATVAEYDDPVISTDETEGSAILAERVDAILGGFKGIASADVLASPTSYQVLNYWALTDWNTYGHIAGAYQVDPGSLTIADGAVNMIDPSMQVVTYCWTGQTSSMMTAWLTALGYDAYSLKNGANSMIYDELMGHKWAPLTADFPMETGS